MEKSQPHNTQDTEPLKDKATESLSKKGWFHRFWFPPKRHLDLGADEWQRQHDEVSISLRRTMITLLGYSFFCMLTLAAPDVSLIAKDAKIQVPFAGTEVSYQAFLIIGPLTMFGLMIYLHILLGHWVSIGKHKDTSGLPYIFNIGNKAANWLANFIFYWLPCLVLAFFSWKALPRPESSLLIIQTGIFFTCMVVLRIQRFPDDQHRFKFNVPYLFGWFLGVCLLLGPQIGLYDRSLDLFRADLVKKDLRDSDLSKANLIDANLNEANLQGANLQGAYLHGAKLRGADLQKAALQGAYLQGAYLWEADLREADLQGAYLWEAVLREADLQEAVLQEANLQGANLQGANLQGAKLGAAKLQKADLQEAVLRGAVLRGADLQGAYLRGADLRGAILQGAKALTVKQLCKASILYEAKLDQKLVAQIKQECPDLLKEPQKINPDEKK